MENKEQGKNQPENWELALKLLKEIDEQVIK